MTTLDRRTLVVAGAATLASAALPAAAQADDAARMSAAARDFLDSLGERRREAALPFDDPRRTDWHWFPLAFRPNREGRRLAAMSAREREAALALLAASTTKAGYDKALAIMSLQADLGRDPGNYLVAVYGEPGGPGPWGWSLEGHHLSLNYTLRGDAVAAGPIFLGAFPTEVESGPRAGLAAMKLEENAARSALQRLSPDLRRRVVTSARTPGDTVTQNRAEVTALADAGVALGELPSGALDDLRAALAEYTAPMPPALAARERARIMSADPARTTFAWMGATEKGRNAFYYWRVQGPDTLVEHDNSRDGATHIHSVWRSFAGDFGRALG